MASRDRRGSQLSVELPPELLQRLKGHAAAHGQPVSALIRRWVELGLRGDLETGAAAPAGGGAGLLERVAALEAAVALLQARPVERAPKRERTRPVVEPLPLLGDLDDSAQPKPEPPAPVLPPPDGAITTAELAERTGTNRAAWNNWAKNAKVGDVRDHPQAKSWRLVGKAQTDGGGPARWLWEPA